jgi:hypothetical protein
MKTEPRPKERNENKQKCGCAAFDGCEISIKERKGETGLAEIELGAMIPLN